MKVSDIMTKNVISVSPEDDISKVAQMMSEHKIHALPVLEGKNQLVGIITESDFFAKDSAGIYLPTLVNLAKQSKIKKEGFFRKDKEIERLQEAMQNAIDHVAELEQAFAEAKNQGARELAERIETALLQKNKIAAVERILTSLNSPEKEGKK